MGAVVALLVLGGGAAATVRSAGSPGATGVPTGADRTPVATASAPAPSPSSRPPTAGARPGSSPGQQASEVRQRCAQAARLAEAAAAASRQGQRDWADHVASYRELVDGRTPYAAARRTWRRTRAAGPQELFRFATAERRWLDVRATCPGPTELPPAARAQAGACATRAAAAAAAVADARAVLGQWHEHQRDMRAADRGDIDRPTAQARFRALVQQAPVASAAARASAARMAAAPACPG